MLMNRIITAVQMAWAERKGMTSADLKRKEIEFLPSELELIHTPPSPAPRVLLWSIVTMGCLALAWSIFGRTDIVATASGKIITSSHTKVIQPFSTGIVRQILVHDGDRVKAGQTLIMLDATEAHADQAKIYEQWQQARLSELRATSLLSALKKGTAGIDMKYDEHLDRSAFDREALSARSMLTEFRSKLAGYKAVGAQKVAAANENIAEIERIKKLLPITQQREADYQKLAQDKFVSEHAVQDKKAQRLQMEGDLQTLVQKNGELSAAILEARSQLQSFEAEFEAKLAKEYSESSALAAQLNQDLEKAKSLSGKTILTAPVDGVVQQLAIHTVGGVVTPAQPLLQVVPSNEKIVVEAWVENRDIGFITPNQRAEVKVETFEHTKYGTIPAKVISVSSDAIQDEKRGLGYIARLELDRSSMAVGNRIVNLGPGFAVTSEIHIGTKRVIEYLLSPLLEAASAAAPR